jgi:hypothetical protein
MNVIIDLFYFKKDHTLSQFSQQKTCIKTNMPMVNEKFAVVLFRNTKKTSTKKHN